MYFKLDLTIGDFWLGADKIEFKFKRNHDIVVLIFAPSDEDQLKGHKDEDAHCVVSIECKISNKNNEIFTKIAENDVLKSGQDVIMSYPGPSGEKIQLPDISLFPVGFRQILSDLRNEMSSAAKDVVNLIRWRCGILGPTRAISSRGFYWSYDKKFWHPAPEKYSLIITSYSNSVKIENNKKKDIDDLIHSNSVEPLHHELFREAWSLRHSHPSSALLIGFASLEVAVKSFLITKIPDAKWLIENLQAPPVEKMLREYIPKLETVNSGSTIIPETEILDLLKNGISCRNNIAHLGKKPPTGEAVQDYLCAIRECLWIIDFNNGNEWATENVGGEEKSQFI